MSYVDNLAWLNAKDERQECDLPPISDYFEYIINKLFQIGVATGGEPITYTELYSYIQLSGLEFDIWELETMRSLAIKYVSGSRKYDSDDYPTPPYMTEETKRKYSQAAGQNMLQIMKRKANNNG